MKKIYLSFMFLFTSLVNAQTLTHSAAQDIGTGSIACGSQTATAANSYYRDFDMNSFGIFAQYYITSIEFGIQNLTNTLPITVILYTTTEIFPANFPAGYTVIGTQVYNIPAQNATVYSAPILATVPANQKLIVQVSSEDQTAEIFRIGSNDLGQTAPSYILATECSITTPTDIATVGFPDMHTVMNVVGTQLGVEDKLLKAFSVSPNPATNVIRITNSENISVTGISVTDLNGRVVKTTTYNDASNIQVNVSDLASGMYLMKISSDKGIATKKIIKN